MQSVLNAIYIAAGLLIGLVAHEYARSWAAVRLGDHTPRSMGRLTLNPKPHVDPFGTLILPAITLLPVLVGHTFVPPLFLYFAYAKPAPVNPSGLRKPDQHGTLIALAGPAANAVLAIGCGALFGAELSNQQRARFFLACLMVNVIMAVMNLVPLPPFDGARVIARFLSPRAREVFTGWDQYAPLIVIVIFFVLPAPLFAFVRAIGNGICTLVAGGACL